MNESFPHDAEKAIFSVKQIEEIAAILGLTDPDQVTHFGRRLQRYSDQYYHNCRRANHTKTPGEMRDHAREVKAKIEELRDELLHLQFHPQYVNGASSS